eukprot:TRINITY_DN11608_c0_g1_i1.p1 TRINITY_DN11608_c0_g1~~TRINITY_DN11608_c0_g1_i1.p1  ORF type:complete len:101 (-),score=23.93 TRINITY_DN11608_c0_g1_i1:18-320(-)
MNDFIDANMESVQEFLTKLPEVPPNTDYKHLCTIEEAMSTEIPFVYNAIVKNLDKIGQTLVSYKQDKILEPLIEILGDLSTSIPTLDVNNSEEKQIKKKQ